MKTQPYILIVAGVIASGLGILLMIPAYIKEDMSTAIFTTFLLVGGLVLIAIGFGEDEKK